MKFHVSKVESWRIGRGETKVDFFEKGNRSTAAFTPDVSLRGL